MSKMYTMA